MGACFSILVHVVGIFGLSGLRRSRPATLRKALKACGQIRVTDVLALAPGAHRVLESNSTEQRAAVKRARRGSLGELQKLGCSQFKQRILKHHFFSALSSWS